MSIPVVISTTKGIPVVPVTAPKQGVPAKVATNGAGIPIVISTSGVPMTIAGYTP
jgi:hypothetical protein